MKTCTGLSSSLLLLVLTLAMVLPGCTTITGTAVSPVTGGVDLVRETVLPSEWYLVPPVFLAGAIAGPVVALYNGINYDARIFESWSEYWQGFHEVFQPYRMVRFKW